MVIYMAATTSPHCESCGSTSPEDISNLADTEGYTRCCNELVCDGRASHTFGTDTENTRACCWAKANEKGIDEGWRH